MWQKNKYDIILVGGGVVGCSLAHALSTLQIPDSPPLRIAVLERSLAEPDRIVGELLQPGGVNCLRKLGIEWVLEDIDAAPAMGYCVVDGKTGKTVHIPYPGVYDGKGTEGRGFHHGRFIMRLREAAMRAKGVDVIEATASELIEDVTGKKITGVKILRKGAPEKESLFASLTIIADGCFSNFRSTVLGTSFIKPITKSHFVGLVLENVPLPIPNCGTVILGSGEGSVVEGGKGPMLLYNIATGKDNGGKTETRMLVDVKQPLPEDLMAHLQANIIPSVPESIRPSIMDALKNDRLRRMPNSFLPGVPQAYSSPLPGIFSFVPLLFSFMIYPFTLFFAIFTALAGIHKSPSKVQELPKPKENVILIGDAWNMRHPLTGGGMLVAFNDVRNIRDLMAEMLGAKIVLPPSPKPEDIKPTAQETVPDPSRQEIHLLSSWDTIQSRVLSRWFWRRKALGATVNILSVALYDLFGGDEQELAILRNGCFKYFERGGRSVSDPVKMLSGLTASTSLLFYHFFSVALYALYLIMTDPLSMIPEVDEKHPNTAPNVFARLWLCVRVFWTAVVVFTPLLWTEVRWWVPMSTSASSTTSALILTSVVLGVAIVTQG